MAVNTLKLTGKMSFPPHMTMKIVQNLLDINETMVDDEGRLPSHREKVKKILESLGDKSDSKADDRERDVQKHIIWSKLFHKFDVLFSRAEELEDELILLRPPDVEQVRKHLVTPNLEVKRVQ